MPERRKKIELPALPKNWNELSSTQMEEVHRLLHRKQQLLRTTDPLSADRHFKLQCFLLFTNLKVAKRCVKDEKGEIIYLLRRRGVSHLMERIPMYSWQINQWIDDSLGFLDEPHKRTTCPYKFIRLYWRKFKAPSDLLTSLTHQQYSSAQNLLSGYWSTLQLLEDLINRGASHEAIRMQKKRLQTYQNRFLSALFTTSFMEKEAIIEGRTIKVNRRVWMFYPSQTEKNEWRFRRISNRMFPVMVQFFQSVQRYYSLIFPDLFTTGKVSGNKDMLSMEVKTINVVMKDQGFKLHQDVYDSQAIRILDVLDRMSKEAKSIEEMNRKMKTKNR